MRSLILIGRVMIVLTAVIIAGTVPSLAQNSVPAFEPDACPFPETAQIQCGWLIVPEDHDEPDGRTIRLAVAVIKSTSPDPQADPVIYLSGGPGVAVVAGATFSTVFLRDILRHRDIVLFDQRGTGLSQPSLNCPAFSLALINRTQLSEDDKAALITDCRQSLIDEGINLSDYNTIQNAADVDTLRTTLGYEQVNLLGGSYGTRLALTVMRDHPDGIRSVILNSTLPAQENTFLSLAANFDHVLQALQDGCTNDLYCRLAYPDIRGVYQALFEQLNQSPVNARIKDPATDEMIDMKIDGYFLSDVVFSQLYNREQIRLLPATLYSAANGDYRSLEAAIQPALQTASGLAYGMYFSVMCGDQTVNASPEQIALSSANYPEALAMRQSVLGEAGYRACEQWGVPPAAATGDPIESTIPTLILAGQYDPITPPHWGQEAAETLSKAYFLEFPGVGHGVTGHPCPLSIAVAFLDAPAEEPQADCLGEMRGLQFVISADRTRPLAAIAALLLGGVALWNVGNAAVVLRRNPKRIAWRASLRSMGWIPLVVVSVALLLLILPEQTIRGVPWSDRVRVVETIIPLAIAIQAALVFAPDDEPALEVLLACPRKISWVLLERLNVILIAQAGIALIGVALTLVLVGDQNVLLTLLRWIPPAVFLSGVAVYTTLRSRVSAFGMVIAALCWFAFSFFGDSFLPGATVFWPLNYLQPFFWAFNPYLQPGSLTMGDYWLNRLIVTLAGIGLLVLAVYQLRDEERLLLGTRRIKKQKEAKTA